MWHSVQKCDLDSRMGLPSEDVVKAAMARAMDEGADPELVEDGLW